MCCQNTRRVEVWVAAWRPRAEWRWEAQLMLRKDPAVSGFQGIDAERFKRRMLPDHPRHIAFSELSSLPGSLADWLP